MRATTGNLNEMNSEEGNNVEKKYKKNEMLEGWEQEIIKGRRPKQTIMTFKRNNNNAHKPHTGHLLFVVVYRLLVI